MALLNWLNKLVFGKGDDGMDAAYNAGYNDGAKAAYTEGYHDGHRNGLRWGKVLKIDAVLYEELKGRVDVSPEQKIISKALVDEIVYGGPRRGGMMCELEGMRFKSAKIVGKDEEPRILSRDRVDKAPGFDSIRGSK